MLYYGLMIIRARNGYGENQSDLCTDDHCGTLIPCLGID